MKQLLSLICFLAVFAVANAQTRPGDISVNDAAALGGQLGSGMTPSITQGITSTQGQANVPGYGTNPSQTQYFNGGHTTPTEPGSNRVAGCTNQNDVECQAVNLLKSSRITRPQFDLTNDPLKARVKGLTTNPSAQTGDIFSTYETCRTTTRTLDPVFETQICNDFSFTEDKTCKIGVDVVVDPDYVYKCLETIQSQANATCSVGRVVNVDTKYNYQCDQSPNKVDTYNCSKRLVVTCDPLIDGCDNGGIVPGSTQGDMRVWFGASGGGEYTLEFGTFADNYWGGWGAVYDRSLTFNINNKDGITKFALINAAFDDWIMVKVNGNLAYVGPYGGDRLEVVNNYITTYEPRSCRANSDGYGYSGWVCYDGGDYGYYNQKYYDSCTPSGGGYSCVTGDPNNGKVQYCATCFGYPELATNWNQSIFVDLRPFLVNGQNTIFMRTIVADVGEGAIRIAARMACPRQCYDNWDNQCAGLEQRSQ